MTHFPTLSYTLTSEIRTLSYTWSRKRDLFRAEPTKAIIAIIPPASAPNPYWPLYFLYFQYWHYPLNNLQTYQYYEIQTA